MQTTPRLHLISVIYGLLLEYQYPARLFWNQNESLYKLLELSYGTYIQYYTDSLQ